MYDVNEARKNLVSSLGEEEKQYFALLKRWFMFEKPLTKIQFDSEVRAFLKTEEQIRLHNRFFLAMMAKINSTPAAITPQAEEVKIKENKIKEEYISPSSPNITPNYIVERSACSEFFLPDSGFIAARIELHIWENGLDGAEDNVAEYMVNLCQMFVKNILTAMISKKESYKIRDGKFQHGFGFPVPDPLLRNSNKILDYTQESKVDVMENEDSFVPAYRPTLENLEQETAFAYACGKRSYSGDKLSVKLLYETLKENPNIIGLHSINSINLLKIGLQLDES